MTPVAFESSDLPFLAAPSGHGGVRPPASFLPLTPMMVVNASFKSFAEGSLLELQLAHEKLHLEQMRQLPFMSGMLWSAVTASLNPADQRKRAEALLQGRRILTTVAPLLEGQALLYFLLADNWGPEIRNKIITDSLAPGSVYAEGLRLLLNRSNITPTSFDSCLEDRNADLAQAGLDLKQYVSGFLFALFEVAPYLKDKGFDPNMIFETDGWRDCAIQTCNSLVQILDLPLTKNLVNEVRGLLLQARSRWNDAYNKQVKQRLTALYVHSIMRQMHPYEKYEMTFPVFFVEDCDVRKGNLPGYPVGRDPRFDHSDVWFLHAAAVRILMSALGAYIKCPIYEVFEGRRSRGCFVEPSEDFCCAKSEDFLSFPERAKICGRFWALVSHIIRILLRGGLYKPIPEDQPVFAWFDAPPSFWDKEDQ